MTGPLIPDATGNSMVPATIIERGEAKPGCMLVPRYLLAGLSSLRLVTPEGTPCVEGQSVKTGAWGDLVPLGAKRIN